jgi:hypothetical protein
MLFTCPLHPLLFRIHQFTIALAMVSPRLTFGRIGVAVLEHTSDRFFSHLWREATFNHRI